MSEERFLVTGVFGCIGSWVARLLVEQGVEIWGFDLRRDPHRLQLLLGQEDLSKVNIILGDITDPVAVEDALRESGATRVIHLAALQVPFCKADPSLGARVNVVGTVNVFEAVKCVGIKHLAYASSVAVFGGKEEYGDVAVASDAKQGPHTLYGVYKQANEGTARIYWQDDHVSSVGLRPHTVYGPGRDQGLTSSPTTAMLFAAAGKAYRVPFRGRASYQFAADVAETFIRAARHSHEGALVLNMRGSVVSVEEIVAAIEAEEPAATGLLSYDDTTLPFPEELDDSQLRRALGQISETPLGEGVAQTMRLFRQALDDGRIPKDSVGQTG